MKEAKKENGGCLGKEYLFEAIHHKSAAAAAAAGLILSGADDA